MLVPGLLSNVFLSLAIRIGVLNERFLTLPVEVFAHQVKDGVDALMRIVLAVATELLCVLSKDALEQVRSHNLIGLVPHLVDELGKGHDEAAFCAERVLHRQLLNKFVSLLEEKARQLVRVAEALETRCHVACVSKV
jgi:hypothetical protein